MVQPVFFIKKGRGQFLLEAQLEYCFLLCARDLRELGFKTPTKQEDLVALFQEGFESPTRVILPSLAARQLYAPLCAVWRVGVLLQSRQ
uniref:Uncharacterized protein n=1 Tax=Nostoc flagelliforme str. Sunitezuoqi TaxID=676037 RepID=E7DQB3_9NOSO|nr:hypothetical protein Nfla_8402 [Nostoc flagelliforme str. Sunitezuoqi]